MGSECRQPLLEEGTILNGKWEVLGHIATGGKGEVYLARQKNLDRDVAVKITSPEFLTSLEDEEEAATEIERFRREVQIMARIRHPNVLQVFDFDRVRMDGQELDYIVMEYVPGTTLRHYMPEEGFGEDEDEIRAWIRKYFIPILNGVETIHKMGIVHRDLKPENILLDGDIPKIADFGLAGGRFLKPVTRSHHILGTLFYMSNEQFMELSLTDFRADVYALGKILYEAVAGKMNKETSFIFKTARLPNPSTPFLKRLDRIIQQATAKERDKRTPSVQALRQALEKLIGHVADASTRHEYKRWDTNLPVGWIVLVFVLIILLGGGIWYHFSTSSKLQSFDPFEPGQQSQDVSQDEVQPSLAFSNGRFPKIISGKDGAVLRLVEGGEITVEHGPEAGKVVEIPPFYMDETEVTNHQYIEFLNKNLNDIVVQGQVVKGEGNIWLLLGEVVQGYEPIIYRDGRFFLNDPSLASHPVVRVTAYGAKKFAEYYGRSIPTMPQWRLAARASTELSTPEEQPSSQGDQVQHMHTDLANQVAFPAPQQRINLLPVGSFPANRYGIKGLNGNVKEWVSIDYGKEKGLKFFLMSGQDKEREDRPIKSQTVVRQPWEAFDDAGFRTVANIKK
ncbi:protein kinase [Desulfohalobiaceae bacterium Ax17]|uniref:bifunctional serine/threonine-protein kinase/formylglycine-generating enzyme family protein n=1 Tax=Desulfovulcanus ferrireducens TaxID=2831190 RepID=UPI00207BC64D|nr:bifunctional serine/threonine-protein kinase/formylglycine-generating enzyme family protein [Desulfovulcanus ferrireducens]MBT8764312.1 protein kinase [Desulfovulcanus ferrireducens]